MHHDRCLNLLMFHNSFDNQGSEINKNDIFYVLIHTGFLRKRTSNYLYSITLFIKECSITDYHIYIFYMNGSEDNTQETYGLKTLNCFLKIKKMIPFDYGILKITKISKNKKQLPETVKQRYKGNQTIKQSFSICR